MRARIAIAFQDPDTLPKPSCRVFGPCFQTRGVCWVSVPLMYILLEFVQRGASYASRSAMGGLGQGSGAELVSSAPLNHWNITPLTPLHSARAKLAASAGARAVCTCSGPLHASRPYSSARLKGCLPQSCQLRHALYPKAERRAYRFIPCVAQVHVLSPCLVSAVAGRKARASM